MNKKAVVLALGLLMSTVVSAQQNVFSFDIKSKTNLSIPANSTGVAQKHVEDAHDKESEVEMALVSGAYVRKVDGELSPLSSCGEYLSEGMGTGVSGEYLVTSGSGRVYCDMVSQGGGWMLYLDFGSSTDRPALIANGIDTVEEVGTYAQKHFTTFNNAPLNYVSGWAKFYTPSTPQGYMLINAPSGYSQMKVHYGNGYRTGYQPSFVVVNVNGVTQSKAYPPSVSGQINDEDAVFPIAGGEKVTISEANSISYLDAVWVR